MLLFDQHEGIAINLKIFFPFYYFLSIFFAKSRLHFFLDFFDQDSQSLASTVIISGNDASDVVFKNRAPPLLHSSLRCVTSISFCSRFQIFSSPPSRRRRWLYRYCSLEVWFWCHQIQNGRAFHSGITVFQIQCVSFHKELVLGNQICSRFANLYPCFVQDPSPADDVFSSGKPNPVTFRHR